MYDTDCRITDIRDGDRLEIIMYLLVKTSHARHEKRVICFCRSIANVSEEVYYFVNLSVIYFKDINPRNIKMTNSVLRLYKLLLRESEKIPSYNYRNYFIRRVRDAFKENKSLFNEDEIRQEIARGHSNLNIIKRQALVGQLYQSQKLIIENAPAPPGK